MLQLGLDFANGVHHLVQFFGSSVAHFVVQVQHLLFHFVHALESSAQYFADGHAFFQGALLVKVTNAYFARPFYFAFVRLQMTGNDVQEGGFTFTVSTNKANVLTAQ